MPISQALWVGEPGEPAVVGDVVTSHPYPYAWLESIDIGHDFLGANMYGWEVDSLDISHNFLDSELRLVLQTYTEPPESIDITHSIADAVLALVLVTYAVPTESIDITHEVLDVVLTRTLIEYLEWPVESIDITHSFDAGTLT